jgi:immune inhibitor A
MSKLSIVPTPLGLMDVYDTDGAESGGMSGGLGALSLMSSGNYNNKSRTPPHLTSEERWSLGWMTPTTITEAGDYSLASIDQNQAYIIPTLNENEYFLLESRPQ